jgi:hypothetical protein
VYRTFCFVEDAVESVVRMIDHPDKSIGHTFNVGNPKNNIQIKELAKLMIDLYSNLTGKPNGTVREVPGVEYYGKGYEDSDLRIPSMRLGERTSPQTFSDALRIGRAHLAPAPAPSLSIAEEPPPQLRADPFPARFVCLCCARAVTRCLLCGAQSSLSSIGSPRPHCATRWRPL